MLTARVFYLAYVQNCGIFRIVVRKQQDRYPAMYTIGQLVGYQIIASCHPHRVTSQRPNTVISKCTFVNSHNTYVNPFSFVNSRDTYVNPFSSQINKINVYTTTKQNIHTQTMEHTFSELVPSKKQARTGWYRRPFHLI